MPIPNYGNGLKHTFTAPDTTVYTYNYGLNNELQSITIPGRGDITISAYTWNRPQTMTFPGGTQRTYAYDALMRLQSVTALDPSSNPLLEYAYTHDEVGNIVTKNTEHGTYTYGYDSVSRLTSANNPVLDDETYTYDDVGNRLTSADVSGSWNYNLNNELLGYEDVEYDYDDNGNMTQIRIAGSPVWTYTYDAANRLIHAEDGTATIQANYYYDPFGRRLWKEVNGTRTYFFYAEEGLIAEYDASGVEIRSYGYKPDSTWTTDPLWLKENGSYYWYQNDHLGTPQKLTAQDGTVGWSAQYTAFGEADVQIETVENNLRFPGQYWDDETELHYNYHRYYDPKVGRYLRKDPIGHNAGDVNLYKYAENNPLNAFDPNGLTSKKDIRKGRLVYSCNCGWIDWGHAARLAIDDERGPLWDGSIAGMDIGIALGKGWQRSKTGEGYLIRFAQGVKKIGLRLYVGGAYFVKDGLSETEKKSVAFAILQDVTYRYEIIQSVGHILPPPVTVRSGFSVDDLVSNLIGLHMAFMGLGPTNERDKVIEYCNVIEDHDVLERIWECAFGPLEDLGYIKNFDWKPQNYNSCAPCCPPEMKWPEQFGEIYPAPKGELWRDWSSCDADAPPIPL